MIKVFCEGLYLAIISCYKAFYIVDKKLSKLHHLVSCIKNTSLLKTKYEDDPRSRMTSKQDSDIKSFFNNLRRNQVHSTAS